MKKLLTALFVLSFSVASFAQEGKKDRKHKEGKNHAQGKHLGKGDQYNNLNLSEAQKSQVKSLNESFRNKMKELQSNDRITVKEQREKREELVKQHQQSLQNILTPEQRKQAEAKKQNYSDKGRNKGEGRFDEMQKELNLSAQQSTRLKEINETHRKQMQELQSNSSLTNEQKKEKRKALAQSHKQSIESVLNNEQKEKVKGRMKNHRSKSRSVK